MAPGTWWRPAPLPFLIHMAVPSQGLLAGKPVGHTRPGHQGEGPEEVAALLRVQVGLLASPGRGLSPSVCPQAVSTLRKAPEKAGLCFQVLPGALPSPGSPEVYQPT